MPPFVAAPLGKPPGAPRGDEDDWRIGGLGGWLDNVLGGPISSAGIMLGFSDGGYASADELAASKGGARAWGNAAVITGATLVTLPEFGEGGLAVEGAEAGGLAEAAEEGAVEEGCFVAGTPVEVATTPPAMLDVLGVAKVQPRPIEQVKAGDIVVTADPSTGRIECRAVRTATVRTVDAVVTVHLAAAAGEPAVETLTCTPEHPFYAVGRGFVEAQQLGIGTQIVTRAGPALFVTDVRREISARGYTVYNLVVPGDHTYFSGDVDGGVWVHNCEAHHLLPCKFADWFRQQGVEPDDYLTDLPTQLHRTIHGDAGGLGTIDGRGGAWNQWWQNFVGERPNATPDEILSHMRYMRRQFRIDQYGIRPR